MTDSFRCDSGEREQRRERGNEDDQRGVDHGDYASRRPKEARWRPFMTWRVAKPEGACEAL
jgi:hypothetical protein